MKVSKVLQTLFWCLFHIIYRMGLFRVLRGFVESCQDVYIGLHMVLQGFAGCYNKVSCGFRTSLEGFGVFRY